MKTMQILYTVFVAMVSLSCAAQSVPLNAIAISAMNEGTYPYKLRSKNDCGCSDWKTYYFEVTTDDNNGSYISPSN
jgi:hypothetical protein